MKKCFEQPNKKRFNTQKEAETAIILSGNPNLRNYKCDACQGWHLTST
jgi:hypothetical protein